MHNNEKRGSIVLSLILRILIGSILSLSMSAYLMIISDPNYIIIGFSYLISVILIGWAISDIVKIKTQLFD